MDLLARLRSHRKDSRLIIGGLAALLLVLVGVYVFILRARDLPAILVTNRVLLLVLLYIDFVLILAIAFVLLRNIIKLLFERHHRILGSRFKTKLVATYVGLSLVPVLILFVYASSLLQSSIDRWFAAPVKQVLDQGHAVAQAMNRRLEATALRDAARVAREIRGYDLGEEAQRRALGRRLRQLAGELQLDLLAVYEGTEFVHAVLNPQSGLTDLPEAGRGFLTEAARSGRAVRVLTPTGVPGRLILTAAAADPIVVVAGTLLDPVLAAQSEQLIEAYQSFRQLEVQKGDLKASHLLTFLMVTLLILLASSWTGLYLARRVTIPILALAEGTKRISGGDLGHRVEAAADDELGVLVGSFNAMTAELERNRALLEQGNRELRAANRRLAEERALIAAVLESVAAGVAALDPGGRILACNRAALLMLRQREEDVVGRTVAEAWGDGELAQLGAALAEELPESGRARRELRLIVGDEWKSFEVKSAILRGGDGAAAGRVVVLEDLTELIKAQKHAAWSEAAKRVAHEIKNPLTPIKLAAERLLHKHRQRDPELGAALEEAVATIVREVETMKAMVDEFSRFARMPGPQPGEVDLPRLVEEIVHLYRGLKPGLEFEVDVGPRRAWFDPEQIKRALINLLDNAVDATDPPGAVRVSAQRTDGRLAISIADSGRGIPAEAKEKLFLPYFSTKGRGSGLGLAIVQRIVSDHHGTIRVEDNRPRGTVFTIELPQS
jgi:two-component system nitrogen regulation sensor histidine kinase NtrY